MAILSLAHQIEKPWNNWHFCPCPLTPKILVHRIKAISQVSFGSHVQIQFFILPVFTCFLQPKKITFGVLLLNHQNSNMVLGSHHNILNLLFLPLLPLSSVTKHYLNNFKNRNRAESTFSIQMSLFKLTVIVVKITPSSATEENKEGIVPRNMITAVSFWRRASKSICKSACYSLLGHYTSYSICLKHIPMSPGTFVSIQMNLCKTKTKFKKPAKHTATWPPTTAAQ